MNIFFTSDQHFHHKKISEYCNRPFESSEEMDRVLIEMWNKTVGRNDLVYLLGDLTLHKKSIPLLLRILNGQKIYVIGNHDYAAEKVVRKQERSIREWLGVREFHTLTSVKIDGKKIILCHFPLLSWYGQRRGSYHLHGHSHDTLSETCLRRMDIGVDAAARILGEYRPFSLEEVRDYLGG